MRSPRSPETWCFSLRFVAARALSLSVAAATAAHAQRAPDAAPKAPARSTSTVAESYSGITAGGKFVGASKGGRPPWADDVIKRVPPEYPISQRERYNQGSGVFRGTIDLETGRVTNVAVKKSTGYPALDRSVTTAMRQWRFKPGKWRTFDLPVSFRMSRSRAEAMEKLRKLRARYGEW